MNSLLNRISQILFSVISVTALAGPPPVIESLGFWETRGNPAGLKSDEKIILEHFEIPLELLRRSSDVAVDRVSRDLISPFLFERNGTKFIRWMINPEDKTFYKEVEAFLVENGVPTTRHKYFEAYATASRSFLASSGMTILDPSTGATFFLSQKVSTDTNGGKPTEKRVTLREAAQIRMMSDYVHEIQNFERFKYVIALDEPIMFGIREKNQALIVRDLSPLYRNGNYYLPAFSAFHENVASKIAKANGVGDVGDFWNQHASQAIGRALGEFAARTGIMFRANHAQNFLIELDIDLRPTGRVVIRDFGESSDLFKPVFDEVRRILRPQTAERVSKEIHQRADFSVAFGLFVGTPFSSEMKRNFVQIGREMYGESAKTETLMDAGITSWSYKYFDAFKKSFLETAETRLNFKIHALASKDAPAGIPHIAFRAKAINVLETKGSWYDTWTKSIRNKIWEDQIFTCHGAFSAIP